MKNFPELVLVETVARTLNNHARVEQLASISMPRGKLEFPLLAFSMGTTRPDAPTLGIVGGVHGLERIGSQVALSFLLSTAERLTWDESLHRDLEKIRILFVPLLNPVGMYLERRSNGNGVDLMRNAPIRSNEKVSFLLGGHRISPLLPWYRGKRGAPMERENQALCDFVRRETFQSKTCVWLDVHSGYGIKDRLWFPYARSSAPFPHLPETLALKKLLDRTYPYHVYQMEPQSVEYTMHGDVWDYLYDERYRAFDTGAGAAPLVTESAPLARQIAIPAGVPGAPFFLPMTLEMGSWLWIRKNPLQFFSYLGPFNPIKPHRKKRTLRRHLTLFDFLMRAVISSQAWAYPDSDARARLMREAHELWYP